MKEIRVRVMDQVDRGEQGLWEVLDVIVAVGSRLRKVVPRIDGSTDSSTSRIGGETSKLHLACFKLDVFHRCMSEGKWSYSTIERITSVRYAKGGDLD